MGSRDKQREVEGVGSDKQLSDEERQLEELHKIEEAYNQLRWNIDDRMGW